MSEPQNDEIRLPIERPITLTRLRRAARPLYELRVMGKIRYDRLLVPIAEGDCAVVEGLPGFMFTRPPANPGAMRHRPPVTEHPEYRHPKSFGTVECFDFIMEEL